MSAASCRATGARGRTSVFCREDGKRPRRSARAVDAGCDANRDAGLGLRPRPWPRYHRELPRRRAALAIAAFLSLIRVRNLPERDAPGRGAPLQEAGAVFNAAALAAMLQSRGQNVQFHTTSLSHPTARPREGSVPWRQSAGR